MKLPINRRNFLKSTGLPVAALVLAPGNAESLEAQAPTPSTSHSTSMPRTPPMGFHEFSGVELAVATICTDGFAHRNHEPAFEILPKTGFKHVEFNLWYPQTLTPRYIQSIRDRCRTTGLQPICLQGTGFGGEGSTGVLKDLSHKMWLLQACRELPCRRIKCTGARRDTQGGLKAVIEVCRELAPVAEDWGLIVTLENHAGNVLERIEDYEEIFAAIDSPNIGMCLDTGHFEGVGIDLHTVIDRFHSRILHVDLKDCRARGEGHNTVVFGEGVTDFDAFLAHLKEVRYSGYLVVEQAWSEPKEPVLENLRKAYTLFAPHRQP